MTLKRTSRRTALLGLGAVAVAGCAASDPDDSGASVPAPEAEEAAQPERGPKARFRKDAFEGFLRDALDEVSLSDAQRAKIDTLAEELRAELKAGKGAKGQLGDALAGAVADGKLEDAEIAKARAAVLDGAGRKARAVEKALNDLHATLQPEQRTQLVAALERRMGEGFSGKGGRKKDWQAKKSEKLARALDLDEAQLAKWREATAKLGEPSKSDRFAERRAHMQAAMKAFTAESFDASSLELTKRFESKAAGRVDRRIAELSALVPLLDAEQLSKLADVVAHSRSH